MHTRHFWTGQNPWWRYKLHKPASSSTGQSVATTTGFASVTSSPFGPGGPGPTGPTGPTGASASPFGGGTTPSPFAAAQATSAGPVTSSPFAQPAGPFAPVATGDGRSVSPFAATGQVSWSESKGSLFYSRDWTKKCSQLIPRLYRLYSDKEYRGLHDSNIAFMSSRSGAVDVSL